MYTSILLCCQWKFCSSMSNICLPWRWLVGLQQYTTHIIHLCNAWDCVFVLPLQQEVLKHYTTAVNVNLWCMSSDGHCCFTAWCFPAFSSEMLSCEEAFSYIFWFVFLCFEYVFTTRWCIRLSFISTVCRVCALCEIFQSNFFQNYGTWLVAAGKLAISDIISFMELLSGYPWGWSCLVVGLRDALFILLQTSGRLYDARASSILQNLIQKTFVLWGLSDLDIHVSSVFISLRYSIVRFHHTVSCLMVPQSFQQILIGKTYWRAYILLMMLYQGLVLLSSCVIVPCFQQCKLLQIFSAHWYANAIDVRSQRMTRS